MIFDLGKKRKEKQQNQTIHKNENIVQITADM